MRLWSLFAASLLIPSDTVRQSPTPAGMVWLRHKPRHTDRVPLLNSTVGLNISRASLAGTEGTAERLRGILGARRTNRVAVVTKPPLMDVDCIWASDSCRLLQVLLEGRFHSRHRVIFHCCRSPLFEF